MAKDILLLNFAGLAIGLFGLYMLFIGDSNIFLWFMVSLLGAMIYGGLPNWENVVSVFKVSPALAIISVAILFFYVKFFGEGAALESLIGTFFSLLILQGFVVAGFQKIFKD